MSSRFLESYEKYLSLSTDASPEFIHASGLACISAIAIGQRWLERGINIHPNLYLLLVAGSSRDRKSTCVNFATEMISEADEDRVGPSDFTAEALLGVMRRKLDGTQRNKLYVPQPELGTLLSMMRKQHGESISSTLCDLYDGNTVKRSRVGKGGSMVIERPKVTMFGGAALGMLEKYSDPIEWITGFFARMLFVTPGERRQRYALMPVKPVLEHDTARAHFTDLKYALATPKAFAVHPEAEDLLANFKIEFNPDDPTKAAQYERLVNIVWKLATIYQIDEDPDGLISVASMTRGIDFARKCWGSFKTVYIATAGDEFSRVTRKIWRRVSEAGEEGIPKRQLLRSYHLASKQLIQVLDLLVKMQAVELKTLKGKGQVCFCSQPYSDEAEEEALPGAVEASKANAKALQQEVRAEMHAEVQAAKDEPKGRWPDAE